MAATAVIAPPPGSACISRARAATSAHASSSDSTPAAYAAATSPDRMTRHRVRGDPARGQQRHQAGLHREQPRLREHRLIRPPVRGVRALAQHHLGHRHPEPASSSPHAWSNAAANTGLAACSSAPIPARWLP